MRLHKHKIIGVICLLFMVGGGISCLSDDSMSLGGKDALPIIDSLVIKDLNGLEYAAFMANDSSIHFALPQGVELTKMELIPLNSDDSILIHDIAQGCVSVDLSEFTDPPFFIKKDKRGKLKKKVMIYDLPVLIINTPDFQPISSKTERVEKCEVKLIDAGKGNFDLGYSGIRGRGNTSWQEPKKPYNMKFDQKISILGMNKSKHWLLIANAKYDRTQLHNYTAHEMAKMTDFAWVPDNRYVELILNGEHKGLYQLYEKIGAEKDKIKIDEIDVSNWDHSDNFGYLLEETMTPGETENSFETKYFNRTGHRNKYKLGWEIKSPDGAIPKDLLDMICSNLNYIEHMIYDDDMLQTGQYRDFYDIESSIDWLLVELAVNNDEMARSKNVFMYKENKNGKLKIGPPWDFDFATFESNDLENFTFNYFVNTALYYKQLRKDAFFRNRMKEKWTYYKSRWEDEVPAIIDKQFATIKRSAKRNELMWPDWLNTWGCYEEHVDSMKRRLISNLNYMDEEIRLFKE